MKTTIARIKAGMGASMILFFIFSNFAVAQTYQGSGPGYTISAADIQLELERQAKIDEAFKFESESKMTHQLEELQREREAQQGERKERTDVLGDLAKQKESETEMRKKESQEKVEADRREKFGSIQTPKKKVD